MERLSITLLLFVILGSAYCELPFPCHITALIECRNPSTESAFGNLNGHLPDEAFLKENCDAVNEELDCLIEHDLTCPIADMFFDGPEGRFRGFGSMKEMLDDICDEDSSLRKDYLQSISCFEENKEAIREDVAVVDTMIMRFNAHYLMENEENSVLDEMVKCITFLFAYNNKKNILEKHCGPVASNAFATIANYIAITEPDQCLGDRENFDRLTELMESFRSSVENIYSNSIE